ncbi:hypothetical protein N8742_02895 [Emcibacteraceae bacterium]|nr:hypothetical protein [Emcibacteraceae bacterium]
MAKKPETNKFGTIRWLIGRDKFEWSATKVIASIISLLVALLLASIISEIIFKKPFLVSPLILALFFPSIAAIWYNTLISIKVISAVVSSIIGFIVWYVGARIGSMGGVLGAVIASSSFIVSGFMANYMCRLRKTSEHDGNNHMVKEQQENLTQTKYDLVIYELGPEAMKIGWCAIFILSVGVVFYVGNTFSDYNTVEECRLREAQKSERPDRGFINRYCRKYPRQETLD